MGEWRCRVWVVSPRPGTTPPTVYPAPGVGHPTCAFGQGSPSLLTLLYTHNKELKASISNRPNLQQTATSCLTAGGDISVDKKSLFLSCWRKTLRTDSEFQKALMETSGGSPSSGQLTFHAWRQNKSLLRTSQN